ncbi:Glycine--tRNA ligase [Geodia barretti]|uniref:Glycine--tRNA ligase n=1 Tax=Geodia barretti TaxID=519541 RepID=A0AA35RVG7_GEOBA|nr:Glycine--tRNA ligase [Geodia barretti]
MAFWLDSYDEEPDGKDMRTVLHFHRALAPVTVAVLPLSRNARLAPTARSVYDLVRRRFRAQFDDAQSIGRRYRRQDEIGTPYCVTVDFDTLDDHAVTIRDRDTMTQQRIPSPASSTSCRTATTTAGRRARVVVDLSDPHNDQSLRPIDA